MMDARTVAIVARAVSEDEATALIEQYGCLVASAAVIKATKEAWDRFSAITQQAINAPLTREQCEDISRRST